MKNIRFLEEILTTTHDYWIVGKQDTWSSGKVENQVWFISVPYSINRGIKRDEIKLTDLEKLQNCEVSNISLSIDYPPFQYGITFYNIWIGFPILNGSPKDFLIKALQIKSDDIFEYKKQLSEFFLLPNEQNVQVSDTIGMP